MPRGLAAPPTSLHDVPDDALFAVMERMDCASLASACSASASMARLCQANAPMLAARAKGRRWRRVFANVTTLQTLLRACAFVVQEERRAARWGSDLERIMRLLLPGDDVRVHVEFQDRRPAFSPRFAEREWTHLRMLAVQLLPSPHPYSIEIRKQRGRGVTCKLDQDFERALFPRKEAVAEVLLREDGTTTGMAPFCLDVLAKANCVCKVEMPTEVPTDGRGVILRREGGDDVLSDSESEGE